MTSGGVRFRLSSAAGMALIYASTRWADSTQSWQVSKCSSMCLTSPGGSKPSRYDSSVSSSGCPPGIACIRQPPFWPALLGALGRNPLKVTFCLHQRYMKNAAHSRATLNLHSADYGAPHATQYRATEFQP